MILVRLLRSFVFRQVLLYTSLSLASMVVLLGFVYWATAGYMDKEIDATIEEEILSLADQYDSGGVLGLSAIIQERVSLNPRGLAIYLLTDENYQPLVGNLSAWPDDMIKDNDWTRFRLRGWGSDHSEVHQVRARIFQFRDNLHLLVGRDVRVMQRARKLILDAMTWGLIITVALALGVGLIMNSRMTRRIDAINQTSREIMEGELSRRVPIAGSGDDFDKLAENLNHMLERIEALMAAVHQVSDNIAHDLRTPLTRLHTRLEQACNGEASAMRSQIEAAIGDAEELLATFSALLRIARIESAGSKASFISLDLASLVSDIAELYEPVAAEKGQQLCAQVTGPVPARGDQHLLFQALANLVDNAIKYAPSGAKITLSAKVTPVGSEVQVADNGPGIASELYTKIFQRFFRADVSRSTPGSGLGLSLVQAVADMHHARVELADNHPGLRVSMLF